ncbi:filamentous hemagglutinin N-terminal domain-containing protein [Phormidesmis sp. 146-35]
MAYHNWIRKSWHFGMAIASAGSWTAIVLANPVLAQLSGDNTLGTNISPDAVVRGILSNQIDGGAIRGANLFHSFREFNIGDGRGVYFSNPSGIQNIISRVTGVSRSDILGTLGVLGNANLFLINPNGIFFGSNARLDVNGSFVGSTASGATFADGTQFSTTDSSPTLTISTPLGLQFGQTAGEIRSQGASLSVQPNQTLALIGGDLSLEGGLLAANGGRVELGSVAGGSRVGITTVSNGLTFDYGSVQNFQNIQLAKQARIEANEPLGAITIQAERFTAQEDSDVSVTTFGAGNAGALTIRAAESVELAGASTNLFGQAAATALGKGGDIIIETKRLTLRDGAQVSSTTFGAGNAGVLRIRASESVELAGDKTALFANVGEGAIGNGGDIHIETSRLTLRDGAFISATTSGSGNAGSINIRASEVVDLVGKKPQSENPTTRSTTTITGTTITTTITTITSTGTITTTTTTTTIPTPSQSTTTQSTTTGLFARAEGGSQGNAGNVSIKTGQLRVQDDARISTSTAGQGKGGNQTIIARDSVKLGYGNLFSQVLEGGQGEGGNITIQTDTLELRNGAGVSVSNLGAGRGGNLEILATNIFLGNRTVKPEDFFQEGDKKFVFPSSGSLRATSASGDGGSITLRFQDQLTIVGGSTISAEAGTASAGGDGGNITISGITISGSRFILANRRENNRITANAFAGKGGNIQIQATDGILGFAPIDPSSRSKITASSKLGLSGTVRVDAPFFDFGRQLTELPQEVANISDLIALGCRAVGDQNASTYVVKGRQSLLPDPVEVLGGEIQLSPIVEAQGWRRESNNSGVIKLEAQNPSNVSWLRPTCNDP